MKTSLRRGAAMTLLMTIPVGVSACGGDEKPAKDKVKAGMSKMLSKEGSIGSSDSNGDVKKISDCIVDQSYSKLSTKALTAVAKGDEESKSLTSDDEKALNSATDTCKKKLGG